MCSDLIFYNPRCFKSFNLSFSLLSNLNSLLERLIEFINTNNVLFENLFGFRAKHSTSLATILIIDKVQNAIEDGNYSSGIFLDLRKAFDCLELEPIMGNFLLDIKVHLRGMTSIHQSRQNPKKNLNPN